MWNLIIILYDCWDQVGVACLGFLNTSQIGGYWNFFILAFFNSFFFHVFCIYFLKGSFVCYGLSSEMAAHIFGPLQTNCLFKRLKNTTIFIARLQCHNNKSLQKFWGIIFYFCLRTLLTDSSHETNLFWHFYHLKKVEGHTEHKQLKRNVTRTPFLYIKR